MDKKRDKFPLAVLSDLLGASDVCGESWYNHTSTAEDKTGNRRGMERRLNDLSKLSRAMIMPRDEPWPSPEPTPSPKAAEDGGGAEEVLKYFSRPAQDAHRRPCTASAAKTTLDRVAELQTALAAKDGALDAIAAEKAVSDERIADLERQLAMAREEIEMSARERRRLGGECARLAGELRRSGEKAPLGAPSRAASDTQLVPEKPQKGILAPPEAVSEAFPGETVEQVLATLRDGLAAAEQSGRDRRAEILRRVLAVNGSSGELERRRAELKQILKDAGGFTDGGTLAALGRLGIRCISGRKHWKLEYADIRMPMSKTPSDYRSAQNCAADMANRCF